MWCIGVSYAKIIHYYTKLRKWFWKLVIYYRHQYVWYAMSIRSRFWIYTIVSLFTNNHTYARISMHIILYNIILLVILAYGWYNNSEKTIYTIIHDYMSIQLIYYYYGTYIETIRASSFYLFTTYDYMMICTYSRHTTRKRNIYILLMYLYSINRHMGARIRIKSHCACLHCICVYCTLCYCQRDTTHALCIRKKTWCSAYIVYYDIYYYVLIL